MQVGCGAGNTIFPLLSTYPDIIGHACDFSPRAVDLVKVVVYLILFSLRAELQVHVLNFCPIDVISPLVELYMQKHKDFRSGQINAFVCDITSEQLTESVKPSSVDIVTMVIYYTP